MDLVTAQPCPRPGRLGMLGRLRLAFTFKRHRRHLGQLDRHLLRDIGLNEFEARAEADRPFWDVPQSWLR